MVAIIWGAGFIASQIAIDAHMSAALIMALRFSVAAAVMFAVCLLTKNLNKLSGKDFTIGLVAGLFLFSAFFTQTVGQKHTTVSHCAFLTATNVVMIPFLVWLIQKRRPSVKVFILSLSTFIGACILTIAPGSFTFDFNLGDLITLLGALLFAIHITVLGFLNEDSNVLLITLIQLAAAAIISIAVFLLTDINSVSHADFSSGFPAILYLGLFSTCLCYFLQTVAQKYIGSAQAGMLLSTEGLFGSAFSVLLGIEPFKINTVVGGLIIFLSILWMEAPERKIKS